MSPIAEPMETMTGEFTVSEEINLQDIPDLSGINDESEQAPWENGWYKATILERREFVDSNGNSRVFESGDTPAASGNGRNVRLQVQVRRTDGRVLNSSYLVNYRPEDLSQQTVAAVIAQQAKGKESGEKMGDLFRPFMTLKRLSQLQGVAGVRAFNRNGDGGLDLYGLYGKEAFVRLKEDSRNPQYKEITDFSVTAPKRAKVL